MTEEKKETEKKKKLDIVDKIFGALIITTISVGVGFGLYGSGKDKGYKQGVQKSTVYQIESAGDLNNDGIDDLITRDGKGEMIGYICDQSGFCLPQDVYLKSRERELYHDAQKKTDDLKKLIEENLAKYESKEIKEGNKKFKK